MQPVLDVKAMSMNFGGLRALDEISLAVECNQIVALIGPNGAGKTTFFNCVTGIYNPTEGDVLINPMGGESKRINGYKPNKVTELGVARTFQNIRLFPNMTVLENVMIGRHCRTRSGIISSILRPPSARHEEEKVVHESYRLLKRMGLHKHYNDLAKNLPYGAQRKLEIARALATAPFLLMLDEPAAGMNPQETHDLKDLVVSMKEEFDIAILLIEHDMKMVMTLSDYIYVMEYGKLIAKGVPAEISENPDVIRAYLGEDADA